ncbi:MAG: prepilin peptidase [Clostridia bacterium]
MLELLYFIMYFFVFLTGISIGSFLNVVIYRVPLNISVAKGRSFCPNCNTQIKNYDLIPILSYLFLKRKCRACKQPISPRYCIIELFTGLIAILVTYIVGFNYLAICIFIMSAILLAIAVIDIDTMTIPDGLIIALIVIAIPIAFLQPEITILERVIGFFAVSLPMLLLTLKIPTAFGGGDIKLLAVCGFIIGYQNILLAMFLASILGGIFAISLLQRKKAGKKSEMCFGPYLSIGIFVSALFGSQIISWYLGLLL